jgi:RNA 3'-terminal phosphate cyclase (ATP)
MNACLLLLFEVLKMIELDGSLGEGGGQILRTALALSLMTGQAFRLINIRAKRPKPGLMRQHLTCVQAAVAITGGQARACTQEGAAAHLGAQTLVFEPAPVRAGAYEFSVGSAGSCMLVFQTVMWPLLLADQASQLTLRGGTHNPMAPSVDFLQATAPAFNAGGSALWAMELRRHGFYPAGGGEVQVQLYPPGQNWPAPSCWDRGAVESIWAECLYAGLPAGVSRRELDHVGQLLGLPQEQLKHKSLRANEGPGNALMVHLQSAALTEVCVAYGEKGISAEQVAEDVAREARAYLASGAPVGEHLADQLMIPLAWAAQTGRVNEASGYLASVISQHAQTNARVIEQFLPVRFRLEAGAEGCAVRVVALSP